MNCCLTHQINSETLATSSTVLVMVMAPSTLKIMLVEDSPSDAALLQESLSQAGGHFHFTHVATWAEAAGCLGEESFDLLLLDMSLPDSSGSATFIRARAAAPHLPIVVLTGLEDEALGLEAVRHGIQDYLVKGQLEGHLIARSIRYALERKQAEEALARSRDELEQLVQQRTAALRETVVELEHLSYALIHDLRAPLRALQGFSEFLLKECGECQSDANRDYLNRIITAAHRMDQLVLDALNYTKVLLGRVPLTRVNLRPLLLGLIDTYPNLQPFKGDIRLEGEFPLVMGNEAGLTQCFSNLMGNAVKFVAPGIRPRIRLWAEAIPGPQPAGLDPASDAQDGGDNRQNEFVRIWVEDNGIGIPGNFQARIFEMFQRGSTGREGTGIGLAIVRKVVERMGGQVGVLSQEGAGSRFWVELRSAESRNELLR
jgi:signal transduction histidine kinase